MGETEGGQINTDRAVRWVVVQHLQHHAVVGCKAPVPGCVVVCSIIRCAALKALLHLVAGVEVKLCASSRLPFILMQCRLYQFYYLVSCAAQIDAGWLDDVRHVLNEPELVIAHAVCMEGET